MGDIAALAASCCGGVSRPISLAALFKVHRNFFMTSILNLYKLSAVVVGKLLKISSLYVVLFSVEWKLLRPEKARTLQYHSNYMHMELVHF